MTLYRLAVRNHQMATWIWKTTAVSSLQAVFQLLKSFRALPQDGILVFVATSKENLNEMLRRENANLASCSVTAGQFLRERLLHVPGQQAAENDEEDVAKPAQQPAERPVMALAATVYSREQNTVTGLSDSGNTNLLEKQRWERESGPGGDHDVPYSFSLPISMSQLLAWTRLHSRVRAGELEP